MIIINNNNIKVHIENDDVVTVLGANEGILCKDSNNEAEKRIMGNLGLTWYKYGVVIALTVDLGCVIWTKEFIWSGESCQFPDGIILDKFDWIRIICCGENGPLKRSTVTTESKLKLSG